MDFDYKFHHPSRQLWELVMYILYKRNCTANIQQNYYNESTTQQTQHNYYIIGTTLVLKTRYNTSKQYKF